MKMKPSTYLFIFAGVIAVGLVGFAVTNSDAGPSPYDDFAKCLTEQGATMYGAWWCPHCEDQKEMFEGAFEHVDYVECSPGRSRSFSQECKDAGIEGTPTWRFPEGNQMRGTVPLRRLAERTGCELPSAAE